MANWLWYKGSNVRNTDKRTESLQVMLTVSERKAAKKAALDAGKTVSDWLRALIRRETEKK